MAGGGVREPVGADRTRGIGERGDQHAGKGGGCAALAVSRESTARGAEK